MNKKRVLFFISLCLAMFAVNFANSAQGILLSSYIEHYGLESAEQGLMSTMQSIGSVLICIAVILIGGRVKRYNFLFLSCSMAAAAMLIIGLKPALFAVLAAYLLLGMGYASNSSITSSLTSELYAGSAAAMGVLHAFFGLGGLLGPLALQYAFTGIGLPWNMVCVLAGIVALAVLAFYTLSARISRPLLLSLKETENKVTAKALKAFFTKKTNLLLLTATFGYMAFQNGMNVWITRYTNVGMGAEKLGAVMLSLFWVGNTCARLTVTRIRLRTEVVLCIGCLLAAALLGAGLLVNNAVILLFFVLLSGFASGASVPQLYHLGCIWNAESSLLSTSILAVTMFLSTMLTAPLTAFLMHYGMPAGMFSIVCFAMLAGAAMLPLVIKGYKSKAA